jgi:hypothetical protein
MGKAEDGSLEFGPLGAELNGRAARVSMAKDPPAKFTAGQGRNRSGRAECVNSGRIAQHKSHAFRCQAMPVSDAAIIGLGIGQAEFGLV